MPLPQVLSALREIILDELPLPLAHDHRKKFIGEHFPGLTKIEIEDLSTISPEKFGIYSGTIFRGETNTLQLHFPITIALMKRHWDEVRGESFNILEFTKAAHRKFPWRGNTTPALMTSIQNYIETELSDILQVAPELNDLARLERASLVVKRALDIKLPSRERLDVAEIAKITVEEFLALEFIIPPSTIFELFDFDVVTFRSYFFLNEQTLPREGARKESILGVGGRTRELNVRWGCAPREMLEFFRSSAISEICQLSALAEAYVPCLLEDLAEETQFEKFAAFVVGLIDTGAIIVYSLAPGENTS